MWGHRLWWGTLPPTIPHHTVVLIATGVGAPPEQYTTTSSERPPVVVVVVVVVVVFDSGGCTPSLTGYYVVHRFQCLVTPNHTLVVCWWQLRRPHSCMYKHTTMTGSVVCSLLPCSIRIMCKSSLVLYTHIPRVAVRTFRWWQ